MNQMNFKEGLQMLRNSGFTAIEIARLSRLRTVYTAEEMDRAPTDMHHLEFVRWLVKTGRLTDQID